MSMSDGTCCPGGWDNGHTYWCAAPRSPIEGERLRVTRLDAQGNPTGESTEVGGVARIGTEPGELFIPESLEFPETFTMEMAFGAVDPDVLGVMTGGVLGTPRQPGHSIEFTSFTPVRRRAWRVVWEFLRRTPRRYTEHRFFIPHATITNVTPDVPDAE